MKLGYEFNNIDMLNVFPDKLNGLNIGDKVGAFIGIIVGTKVGTMVLDPANIWAFTLAVIPFGTFTAVE